jgi:hypothetical protein
MFMKLFKEKKRFLLICKRGSMFKVEITLVLIVALVITGGEGKIGKPGNKPPGRQVDCNSDNLPDIAESKQTF